MRRPVPRLCGGYGDVLKSAPRRPGTAGRPHNGAGSCAVNAETGLGPLVENFRAARRDLEASVLPLATSVDGRRFSFQASLHGLGLQVGGYVVLEGGGLSRLGQVITLELDRLSTELMLPTGATGAPENRTQVPVRFARGEGMILDGDPAPFHDVLVRPATAPEVDAWLRRSARRNAHLRLGELALATGVPCLADAGGFNRHTFLCGQSGSGKTYSLGVILEQLLIETDLRVVVLDPNSDFVRLGQVRAAPIRRWPGATRRRRAESPSIPPTLRAGGGCGCTRPTSIRPRRPPRSGWTRSRTARSTLRWPSSSPAGPSSSWRRCPEATVPRRAAWPCAFATWASTASGCGLASRPARYSTRSTIRVSGASSSTWARCRRARSSRSWPPRSWATCGGGGRSAGRCWS